LLGLQVFNDRHTGENVKNIVQKVLNRYNYDFDDIVINKNTDHIHRYKAHTYTHTQKIR
jgi:hypothetical protein